MTADSASAAAAFARLRESDLWRFAPVVFSLAAIWIFFGLSEPAFLSARNIHFLLMQSAVVATLALWRYDGAVAGRYRSFDSRRRRRSAPRFWPCS